MQRGACSGLQLKLLKLYSLCCDFSSLGFFLTPFTPSLLSYSPILCALTPHFLHTLFISNPSLFILTLSPSIWWNSAADNACNWSDSHFSSVFGPDKEYCQHFADMASAGRIKWTLFCSVCSKLKASQFICSRPRLTGASYSHKNTVERGEEENKRDFLLPQEAPLFWFCSSPHSVTVRRRHGGKERSRLIVQGKVKSSSKGSQIHYARCQLAAVSYCLCAPASVCVLMCVFV